MHIQRRIQCSRNTENTAIPNSNRGKYGYRERANERMSEGAVNTVSEHVFRDIVNAMRDDKTTNQFLLSSAHIFTLNAISCCAPYCESDYILPEKDDIKA